MLLKRLLYPKTHTSITTETPVLDPVAVTWPLQKAPEMSAGTQGLELCSTVLSATVATLPGNGPCYVSAQAGSYAGHGPGGARIRAFPSLVTSPATRVRSQSVFVAPIWLRPTT